MAMRWRPWEHALLTAQLKYERAQLFSSAAVNALHQFQQQKLHTLKHDGRYTLHSWMLEVNTNIPPEIMLNVGDAIHNWRSALDHCAYTFWKMDNYTFTTSNLRDVDVYFPITSKAREYRKKIDQLSLYTDARTAFLEFEAFEGGLGDTLFCLSKLDNIDKHRMIPQANVVIRVSDIYIKSREGVFDTYHEHLQPVEIKMSSNQMTTSLTNPAGVKIFGYYVFPPMEARRQRFVDESKSSSSIEVELAENIPLLNHHCGRSLSGSLSAFSVGVYGVLDTLRRVIQHRIDAE
ncbi:hypothetical protein [Sphingomonas sp. Leaf339]|uniref:hypothetical protein n=1 Tax=Sphingomonas sp. Leaf339 TaxID=1736343 RepID=UPI000ABFB5BD|nr:hypothetical protein [Sphingomonas sp. Leaf339]